MNKIAIAMSLGLAMIAGGALAQATTSGSHTATKESCDTLHGEYSKLLLSQGNISQSSEARQVGDEGVGLCQAGNYKEGVSRLEQAVKLLESASENKNQTQPQ